ncbi:MAG: FkbM family methyltransferase [Chitinophagaceae bacterium]|nr:MAG: FkbM family methyltransferase [Chitinophagaceae bacterium]
MGNIQHTDHYFEATVDRLSSIMKEQNHSHIDILKLDIEGAEFEVIDTMIADNIDIRVFCVEFHTRETESLKEIQQTITKLEDAGYFVISRKGLDFSFMHQDYL